MKICLIPAREGSKRIKNKNIKFFCGKPLISYSIELAKKSKLFDDVIVSTDSKKIAKIARRYGASTPFLRPKKISNQFSLDKEVVEHFLNFYKEKKIKINYLCYLYPTAPLLKISTLKKSFIKLKNSNYSKLITVCNFSHPIQRALKKNKLNEIVFLNKKKQFVRSQDLTKFYYDAGQVYWYNIDKYFKNREKSKTLSLELNRYDVQDIDTLEDFKVAEKLYKLKLL